MVEGVQQGPVLVGTFFTRFQKVKKYKKLWEAGQLGS